jgi:hypothetical protein
VNTLKVYRTFRATSEFSGKVNYMLRIGKKRCVFWQNELKI